METLNTLKVGENDPKKEVLKTVIEKTNQLLSLSKKRNDFVAQLKGDTLPHGSKERRDVEINIQELMKQIATLKEEMGIPITIKNLQNSDTTANTVQDNKMTSPPEKLDYTAGKNTFFEFLANKEMNSPEVQKASMDWMKKFYGNNQITVSSVTAEKIVYMVNGLPQEINKNYIEIQAAITNNTFGNFNIDQINYLRTNIANNDIESIQSFYNETFKDENGDPKYSNLKIEEGKLWLDHIDEDGKTVHETIQIKDRTATLRMMPALA